MQGCRRLTVAIAIALCGLMLGAAAEAANPTVGGAVSAYANYVTTGVIASITGDDNNNGSAKVWYRAQGAVSWTQGHPMYRLDATRYAGSIFWLTADTTYEVDVELMDPDGVGTDPVPFLITTKSETIPGQGMGSHIWVSPTGDDSGAGTQLDPYQTISKAHSVSLPGAYIHVLPGIYRESLTITRSGDPSAYITYKAEGAGVILESSDPVFKDGTPDWTWYTGDVYVANCSQVTTYVAADGRRLYPRSTLASLLNNSPVSGNDAPIYDGFYYDASAQKLYVSLWGLAGGDPDDHVMDVATLPFAIRLNPASYIVIDGFEIRYYGTNSSQYGIQISSGNWNVIRNCTVHHCGQAIWLSGRSNTNDNLVTDNELYDTVSCYSGWPWEGQKGTDLEETAVCLQAGWGNVIRNNVVHGIFNGIGPAAWSWPNDEAYNGELDIYGNYIYDIPDDCIEPEGRCINLRIFNNTLSDFMMGFSFSPVTMGPCYFMYNDLYDWHYLSYMSGGLPATRCGSCLKPGNNSSGRVFIYHNTFVTTVTDPETLAYFNGDVYYNTILRNNIFYSPNYGQCMRDKLNGGGATSSWDWDCIYTPDPNRWLTWANPTGPQGVIITYPSLEAWRDALGIELNGIFEDPLFTDVDNGDLTLQAGSPLIDRGAVLVGINDGYIGSAPDIGAYESGGGPRPPVADFTGNPRSGYVPLTVMFSDLSNNSPTSWSWTFGDGGTSTARLPTHTYTSAGSYEVSLTATNSSGSDTKTITNYITANPVPPAPVAGFSGSPTSGTAPVTVSFSDLSTNSPTSWLWSFGDGVTSTNRNPVHAYYVGGSFTVSLTASNAGGSSSETKTGYVTVTVLPPVADFVGSPTSGMAPLTVSFTDTSANSPTSWSWSFGDGGASDTPNPSHQYAAPGVYTVSLTVTNATGSNTKTRINYIIVSGALTPNSATLDSGTNYQGSYLSTLVSDNTRWQVTAVLVGGRYQTQETYTFNTGMSGLSSLTVTVEASVNTGSQTQRIYLYNYSTQAWDQIDSSTITSTDSTRNVTITNPANYIAAGTVMVRVYTGGTGTSSFRHRTDWVRIAYPPAMVADFTGSPTSGVAPLTVSFADFSAPEATSWLWDFGDGATSSEQNPSHQYTEAGQYTVSLTASNVGGSDTMTKDNYIAATYQFLGFLPPVAGATKPFKAGSTIPIKFRVADGAGNPVPDAVAVLDVYYLDDGAPLGEAIVASMAAGEVSDGFRYDADEDLYIYNLSTKDPSYLDYYTYTATIELNDGQTYSVNFALK